VNQWEREEAQLERDLNDGRISRKQYDDAMRELARDQRDAAEEAANEAYNRELERW
jgi:hypothetical protein